MYMSSKKHSQKIEIDKKTVIDHPAVFEIVDWSVKPSKKDEH